VSEKSSCVGCGGRNVRGAGWISGRRHQVVCGPKQDCGVKLPVASLLRVISRNRASCARKLAGGGGRMKRNAASGERYESACDRGWPNDRG
jgi:hypothetical protein